MSQYSPKMIMMASGVGLIVGGGAWLVKNKLFPEDEFNSVVEPKTDQNNEVQEPIFAPVSVQSTPEMSNVQKPEAIQKSTLDTEDVQHGIEESTLGIPEQGVQESVAEPQQVVQEQIEPQIVQEQIEPQIVQEQIEPQVVQDQTEPQIVQEQIEPQIVQDQTEPQQVVQDQIEPPQIVQEQPIQTDTNQNPLPPTEPITTQPQGGTRRSKKKRPSRKRVNQCKNCKGK